MEPYLYHGIKWCNYDLLIKIIESGYILPRNMLEDGLVTDKNNIFNGTEYISLCQKSLYDPRMEEYYRCSFDDYIINKPSLVLQNNDIKIVYPRLISLIDKDMMSTEEWKSIIFHDGEKRYSYYMDELQTKDPIKLASNLIAVALPVQDMTFNLGEEKKEEVIERVREALKSKGYAVPLIDSSTYSFADNKEQIEKSKILIKKS